MSQLPSRANTERPSMSAIGSSMQSSTDVLIQESKSKAVSDTFKNYPDVVEDNARRGVNAAAAQSGRETLTGLGASSETADQAVNVATYGASRAQDSAISLGATAIDSLTGTNVASDFVDDILPNIRPTDTEGALAGGQAPDNSPVGRIRRREDPLFSFRWLIQLPVLGNVEGLDMEIFNYYVEEVNISLPFFSSEQVFRDGSYIYYPQFSDVGSLSLTLYEDHNMTTSTYFEAWKNLIQDPVTRFYNRPKHYKKNIYLTPLDAMNIPCGTFLVEGAFPSNPGTMNFLSEGQPVKRTIEFGLNRITFKPWEGREEAMANARPDSPDRNGVSARIKQGNLSDIAKNPIEFLKQSAGLTASNDFKIRF